jgi:type III restriction enzyme
MPFTVTEQNISALEPLFKPWEEPIQYRLPNTKEGQPAVITAGRRPSKIGIVRAIRTEVDEWRRGGYAGATPTSRTLIHFWFDTQHQIPNEDGALIEFRYHWAQREGIETIIYLYEIKHIHSVAELLVEFGDESLGDLALGMNPEEDRWARQCCKVATGGGKTKIMSLVIAWSYFNSIYEKGSPLPRHFVLIAPNLTVYERLMDDFENLSIFNIDPVIPEEWKSDFQMQVVLQDKSGGSSTRGAIYLTNIHRLYENRVNGNRVAEEQVSFAGPPVNRGRALDTGESLRNRITSHPSIMVLNDEAHHLHDPELAWVKAIDAIDRQSLSKGNQGICLQVDFTATPKHNDGTFFRHIICDFPLGEAVDAGIVKVPVIGESDQLTVKGDRRIPAPDRYRMHLKLGYERYAIDYERYSKVRKPVLFVMTEDAQAANEIADYLDDDAFPLLKGRVLNIHTRLKGRIKTYQRNGREVKEFVENETSMSDDDLRALREMSRDLDSKDSKFRCVVSVMMLREGWDVKNVTTIIPLRPYKASSGILPEQTLGRGLRRMFPLSDGVLETVTVVHHPAFKKLYQDELAQEGLDIAVLPLRETIKQTVSIFVDADHKDVKKLDIQIPLVSDSVSMDSDISGLTFEEIQKYFHDHFKPLPIGKKKTSTIEYKERHLFTDELVSSMRLDAGLLEKSYSASSYFAQMIGRACHISNPHPVLTPLIEQFIAKVLFKKEVNLYSGEVDHRMREMDVSEHIRATFTPLIIEKTIHKETRKQISEGTRLSDWAPYQATSTQDRPAVQGQRTMFNLVPCDSEFEQQFVDFCDSADDVIAFGKNAGPQKLMIDYMRPGGYRALYVPDFFVTDKKNVHYLVELKGRVDTLVPIKARAALDWCKTGSKSGAEWRYLYIPYSVFSQSAPSSIEELSRACEPSLKGLITEAKTSQMELPIAEAAAQKASVEFFQKVCQEAGVASIPELDEDIMRQSVQLLDYAVRSNMRSFSHAFQPLLQSLDNYCITLLENKIAPHIPNVTSDREMYFKPYTNNLPPNQKPLIEQKQHYLRDILVFGRRYLLIGTLLFCLRFAQQGGGNVAGVWKDVYQEFSGQKFSELHSILSQVNDFRNKFVAHPEEILSDADESWKAMKIWLKCVSIMSGMSKQG